MKAALKNLLKNTLQSKNNAASFDFQKKIKIISIISGIVIFFVIIIVIVTIVMAPIMMAQQLKEDVKNDVSLFFEKVGNVLTFKGWCADSDGSCQSKAESKYYDKLYSVYEEYQEDNVELDIELITATIFYGSTITEESFSGKNNNYEDVDLGDISTLASHMVSSKKIDYSKYRKYLVDTYIPKRFKELYTSEDESKAIERIADEIMSFAKSNNAYGSNSDIDGSSCVTYSCNVVYLTGNYAGEYTLDDYIKGVVNAESGWMNAFTPNYKEQWKAQAIAARSMVLSQYDICSESVPNTTNFQAFKPGWSDELANVVDETAGMVLTDNNNIFLAQYDAFYKGAGSDYYCDENLCYSKYYIRGSGVQQSNWETHIINTYSKYSSHFLEGNNGHGVGMSQWGAAYLADIGKSYDEILDYYYADNIVLSKIGNSCSVNLHGYDWRQSDPRWGSRSYGGATLSSVGCNLTSIAIEIAHSGSQTVLDDFNPGTLFDFMKERGYLGYYGNTLNYYAFSEVAPDFNYAGSANMNGFSDERIYNTLKNLIDNKNYPIVHVKSGNSLPYSTNNHWVAVVGYTDDDIEIIDPANTGCTRLFTCKPGLDRSNGYGIVDMAQYWN